MDYLLRSSTCTSTLHDRFVLLKHAIGKQAQGRTPLGVSSGTASSSNCTTRRYRNKNSITGLRSVACTYFLESILWLSNEGDIIKTNLYSAIAIKQWIWRIARNWAQHRLAMTAHGRVFLRKAWWECHNKQEIGSEEHQYPKYPPLPRRQPKSQEKLYQHRPQIAQKKKKIKVRYQSRAHDKSDSDPKWSSACCFSAGCCHGTVQSDLLYPSLLKKPRAPSGRPPLAFSRSPLDSLLAGFLIFSSSSLMLLSYTNNLLALAIDKLPWCLKRV